MTDSIEKKIDTLNGLIDKIEEESTSINDSVNLYSDAMSLAKESFEDLNKIQQKINIIKKQGDSLVKDAYPSD